ncbi:hypothetical protein AV274_1579 [Blastocystis sp. ATCC 50177/Nand II]|uniref:Uncharacterized protein n=1 Tax=Blastocystis sp. subtype 1 (strain ATCC 50177 / NandII) TaxID=478820 RepID=A0A196SKF7_BLAHN|nr:hypothetical protein AV274_1579 [Blastocystis sp. ATCC 50177/Nand II]
MEYSSLSLDIFPCSSKDHFKKNASCASRRSKPVPRIFSSTILYQDVHICNDPDETYLQRQFRKQFL